MSESYEVSETYKTFVDNDVDEPYSALSCVPKDLRSFLYGTRYNQITEEELDEFRNKLADKMGHELSSRICITLLKDKFEKEKKGRIF